MSDDAISLETTLQKRATRARERHALLAAELYAAPRGLVTDAERSVLAGVIAGVVVRLAARLDVAAAPDDEATVERLRRVGLLSDPDLVGAAYHRMLEYDLERRSFDEALLTELAAGRDLEVVHAITEYRVWSAARIDSYGNPVLDERDIPLPTLTNLCWAIAAARGLADPAREDVIEASTLGEIAALADSSPSPPEMAARVLIEAEEMVPGLLVRLMEGGEIALAEAVIAQLAAVPVGFVRGALFEPGGETLAVVASAAALELFNELDGGAARRILARITRNPAYLAAVRRLEGSRPPW